jgi:hypothetical protein
MPNIIKLDPENITQTLYDTVCQSILRIGNVDDELVETTVVYSYYYGIMVRSKLLLDEAVDALEQHKASTRNEKRKDGKLTAVAGEDLVNSLPETADLNSLVRSRQEIYGYAKGICNSLEMKKDMLVQLSANSRQESKLYQ